MNGKNALVRDAMTSSQVFVYEKSSLFTTLETMKNFRVESIPIIKEDLSVVGFVSKSKIIRIFNSNISKDARIIDLIEKYNSPIVLYPRMTIMDAYSTMKYFNINGLPVVDLPWEKKMIGFLWLDDIIPIIEECYLKVSV